MGMSASQVRLLTITSRIHSLENEAQRLQNQKMILGLQSDEAYEKYLEALEKKDIELSTFNTATGAFEWDKASIDKIFAAGYAIKVRNLADAATEDAIYSTSATKVNVTVGGSTTYTASGTDIYVGMEVKDASGNIGYVHSIGSSTSCELTLLAQSDPAEWIVCTSADELAAALGGNIDTQNPALLRELVYNAYAIICNVNVDEFGETIYDETSVATNIGLREQEDDSNIAMAEAEYEAALRRIDRKEQKYDTDLAAIDQQRSALTNQLDTMKTCIKDNIDRTFKLFS